MSKAETVAIRRIRCPKCRGIPSKLVETSEAFTDFFVTDDGSARDAEGFNTHGNPVKLQAVCRDCGHRWRLRDRRGRGAVQVWDIDVTPGR